MDRTQLRQILVDYFSVDDLSDLCFELGVEYDDLPAASRAGKARDLIIYIQRRNRLPELVEKGKQLRPDVPWGASSSSDVMPTEIESLRRQLADERANLLLIEEQKSKYVLETDVPLNLIKEERAKKEKIAALEARLGKLETASPRSTPAPGPEDALPLSSDINRDSLRDQLQMAERVLAVYEKQAAGYTTLTIPAHLVVNLEEQREKVARLREQLAAVGS